MRTLSFSLVLVGIAFTQTVLTLQPRAAAQSDEGSRYAPLGSNPNDVGILSPADSDASAVQPPSVPLNREPWDNDVARSNVAFSSDQPTGPEEIPRQAAPDASTRVPLATQAGQGAAALPPNGSRSDVLTTTTPTTAKEWVTRLLISPNGGANGNVLTGEPLTLDEAMRGSIGRQRQTEVVAAYWHLVVAVAKFHAGHSNATISAADAGVAKLEAKLEAVRAQHQMALVLQWPQGTLPLPASEPHVGSYNTRYDEIYSGRFSRPAWELDQTLPLMHEIVKARANEISRTRENTAEFRAAAGDFLDAVGAYNLAIAEYALLAAGDSLNGRDLVPLLIRANTENESMARAASQRTSTPPRRDGRMASIPPGDRPASSAQGTATRSAQGDATESGLLDDAWRKRIPQSPDLR